MSRSLLTGCFAKHNPGLGPRLAALLLLAPFTAAVADWIGDARPMMGTEVSVYLWSDDPEAGRLALEKVFEEAVRIDRLMSTKMRAKYRKSTVKPRLARSRRARSYSA